MWKLIFIFFALLNVISIFVTKKISKIEIYITSIFAVLFGILTDMIFNLKLNLYGYFDKGFQWKGLFGEFLYFIPISFLYLNFFPFDKNVRIQFFYIICWSIASTVFEYLVEKTWYFTHYEWKIWYSALLYPVIFYLLLIHLKFVNFLIKASGYQRK